MTDNVTALRMCSTVHDHWLGMEDTTNAMTESQKMAKNTKTNHRPTYLFEYKYKGESYVDTNIKTSNRQPKVVVVYYIPAIKNELLS